MASSASRFHAEGRLDLGPPHLRPERDLVHRQEQLARRPADTPLALQRPIEPRMRLQRVDPVGVARRLGALDPVDPGLDRRRQRRGLGYTTDRRGDQQQSGDPLRMRERGVDRDASALRAPDEDGRRARGARVEHGDQVADVRVLRRRRAAFRRSRGDHRRSRGIRPPPARRPARPTSGGRRRPHAAAPPARRRRPPRRRCPHPRKRPRRRSSHPGRVATIDSRPANHSYQAAAFGCRSRQASDANRKSR